MMGAIAQPARLLGCKCLLHVVLSKPYGEPVAGTRASPLRL